VKFKNKKLTVVKLRIQFRVQCTFILHWWAGSKLLLWLNSFKL